MPGQEIAVLRDFPIALLPSQEVAAVERMTSAELRRALAESLGATAQALVRLALIVRVLEERGEDVSELRLPLLTYLRLIAHGQLVPELVARFAENPPLVRQLSFLPLAAQRSLAAGEPVILVVRNGDGYTHRRAEPSKLDMAQRNQVFARDHVRSEEEQILYLESRKARLSRPRGPTKVGRLRADRERGGLVMGRSYFPRDEVLEALAGLRGATDSEPEGERDSTLIVKLTAAEHQRIRTAAAQAGSSMQQLAVDALRAAGLV